MSEEKHCTRVTKCSILNELIDALIVTTVHPSEKTIGKEEVKADIEVRLSLTFDPRVFRKLDEFFSPEMKQELGIAITESIQLTAKEFDDEHKEGQCQT